MVLATRVVKLAAMGMLAALACPAHSAECGADKLGTGVARLLVEHGERR